MALLSVLVAGEVLAAAGLYLVFLLTSCSTGILVQVIYFNTIVL